MRWVFALLLGSCGGELPTEELELAPQRPEPPEVVQVSCWQDFSTGKACCLMSTLETLCDE